jgi:hypothetical protein
MGLGSDRDSADDALGEGLMDTIRKLGGRLWIGGFGYACKRCVDCTDAIARKAELHPDRSYR